MLSRRFFATTAANYRLKILTQEQVDTLHKDGWLYLPQMLSKEKFAEFKSWAEEIEQWPETPGKWMKYYEPGPDGSRMPARIENMMAFHDPLRKFRDEFITQMISDAYGEPAIPYKDKINFKYPHGGAFTAHQDQPAYTSFGIDSFITCLIPIDPNTRETGGLDFVRKHHHNYIMPQNSDGSIRTDLEARVHWVPIDAYPGDLFLFDSYALHRSDINVSTMTRRNMFLTYNKLSDGDFYEGYYEQKAEHFPQDCERDPNKDYSEGAKVFNVANPIK